ncbi:hypothetical protein [Pseudacidovorax sp. NFM-22]|uniref:hypothetical protein n=1 Tax=Pseudacidovorax sp. NFM-22 TaxID=2744469 RepID=UPI001F2BB890|nr:hypothetical protein [Pseudacidovorax sp. NFM-22]
MNNIVNALTFCRNLPSEPGKRIARDNLYSHLEKLFTSPANCVFIDGLELSGKSEFVAEYCRKQPETTVSVFLHHGDAYFYSQDYARLAMAEQMHWILHKKPSNFDAITLADYTRLLHMLHKQTRSKRITFVIDGLVQSEKNDSRTNREILQLLPLSQPNFKFLITGDTEIENTVRSLSKAVKTMALIEVSREEATEYFSDFGSLSVKEIDDIRKFCGGSIGAMSRFKQILTSGAASVADVLQYAGNGLEHIMEIEWKRCSTNKEVRAILANLAFATRKISLVNLALMTGLHTDDISALLSDCSFVSLDTTGGTINIPSTSQRNFLQQKLRDQKETVEAAYLTELLKDPESKDAVLYLPTALMQAGKYNEIVKKLDENHFFKILDTQKSLRALRTNSEIGLQAARKINDESEEIRFSLTSSLLKGLTFSVGTKARIEALIKLGLSEEAISLAMSAPTEEERFHLLALVGKVLVDQRQPVPETVKAEIDRLYAECPIDALGDLAIDIACDLLAIDLDAAISLFSSVHAQSREGEKSDAHEMTDEPPSAAKKFLHEQPPQSEQNLGLRLPERHHRQFINALGMLVDRTSASQILRRAGKDVETSSEIFFLKEWLSKRKKDVDAYKVANLSLDLMLRDLSRPPMAEDLRAVAEVLPYCQDVQEAERLINRIHALVGTELFLGTSVETVRMQMAIERTRHKSSQAESEYTILELFYKIDAIDELSTKVECFSWLLHSLQRFDSPEEIEQRTGLLSSTTDSLVSAISNILSSSADHYAASKGAIVALARNNIDLALELAGRLNTSERRDFAFAHLADELFANGSYVDHPGKVFECINSIVSEARRAFVIISGLKTAANHAEKDGRKCPKRFLDLVNGIRVANLKFLALAQWVKICRLLNLVDDVEKNRYSRDLDEAWANISVDWVKCDVAYAFAADMATADPALAESWLSKAQAEEQLIRTPSKRYAEVLQRTISLAVRAFAHLADDSNIQESYALHRINTLIDALPVPQDKIINWGELGIALHFANKRTASKFVCSNFIEPLINDNLTGNEYVRELMIEEAAPILYLSHPASAIFHIDKIKGKMRRDVALSDVCMTLLRHKGPYEQYKAPENDEYEIDSETATAICQLLDGIHSDWIVFSVIKALAASLASKKNIARIRRPHAIDLLTKLAQIIEKKFPDIDNIRHDGYKISSEAQIFKARVSLGITVPPAEWQRLYASARAISNAADRSVVTGFVLAAAKAKHNLTDAGWAASVKSDILAVPTIADRLDRFVWLAEIISSVDKPQALAWSRDAMALSIKPDVADDAFDRQTKIIDLVYSIDPDAVNDYIELADKDEARSFNKKALEERLKLKNLQKDAAEDLTETDFSDGSMEDVAELCMRNLAALNANRIIPLPINSFKELASRAATFGIDEAYCVWSWILENSIRKTPSGRVSKTAEEILGAALVSGALLLRLLRGSEAVLRPMRFSVDGLVRPGDRESVMAKISDWAREIDGEDIFISDPFFGPSDMDILFHIVQAAPASAIKVLTSKKHIKDQSADSQTSDLFEDAWRSLADISPKDMSIGIIGMGSAGAHPIHDRWLVSKNSGLRLGTSANSIGLIKLSEVSDIDSAKASAMFNEIDALFNRKRRSWEGMKVSVSTFDIL